MKGNTTRNIDKGNAFAELERGVHAALENYSNIHRGSGHFSMVSKHLFEHGHWVSFQSDGCIYSRFLETRIIKSRDFGCNEPEVKPVNQCKYCNCCYHKRHGIHHPAFWSSKIEIFKHIELLK